jgi:hypothetical protein
MNLEKVLSITGKPGLYELKIQTRSGFVAESLLDGKRITVGMRNNVSLLSEISMYTYSEEVPLSDVMRAIAKKENNGPAISGKEDNAALLAYFREVLPEFDEDRVYPSDIRKLLNWYNLLQSKGMVSSEETEADTDKDAKAAVPKPGKTPPATNESPAKAPAKKPKKD